MRLTALGCSDPGADYYPLISRAAVTVVAEIW